MVAYYASINQALLPEQNDLKDHKEHCSADPEKLATVGRLCRHQVRIKRNDDEYGLFTVSEVRQETRTMSFAWANAVESGLTNL